MRKAQIIFDITELKTEATVIDTKGISEKIDITDTKMEKALIRLIKQLNEESQLKQVREAIDINNWTEG